MSRHGGRENIPLDCKVYVGELGNNGTRGELEDAFGYYGPLKEVWVARNPPGFAFVMFQDPRDARDAVRGMDGKMLCGRRIRVELSTGKSRHEKGRHGGPSPRGEPYGRGGRESPPYRSSRRAEPYYGDSVGSRGSRGSDRYSRRKFSRSRSRSLSPVVPRGRPRTPPSRSRSPVPKSPRQESRYRYGDR